MIQRGKGEGSPNPNQEEGSNGRSIDDDFLA